MEEQKDALSSQEVLKTERYLWIARAFSAVAVLAFVANVILFAAIGSLYPLVRIQPFYLNIMDKNQQVIDIQSIDATELQSATVLEALVRQYVLARYEVGENIQEVEERWEIDGIVSLMSTPTVYEEVITVQMPRLENDIKKDGLTVKAFITTAQPISKNRSKWQVNLKLQQMRRNSVAPEEKELIVRLEVQYDPLMKRANRPTWQDRLKNPLGFRVISYDEQ